MDHSSENRQEQENQAAAASFRGTNPPENNPGGSASSMDFCFGSSVVWTAEEQAILDQGLINYASEPPIKCYTKIAADLPNKTVRDVAYRFRWMTQEKEVGNRRKEIYRTGNSIGRRGRMSVTSVESASSSPRTHLSSNGSTTMQHAVGGTQGLLVRCNYQILNQIEANLKSCKLEENIALFYQFRNNFSKLMSNLNETPEFTNQMPPLPVNADAELESIFQLLSKSQYPDHYTESLQQHNGMARQQELDSISQLLSRSQYPDHYPEILQHNGMARQQYHMQQGCDNSIPENNLVVHNNPFLSPFP